ncbi:GNAT family N-acetyltransferase [Nocardioides flavescens]|uniref:GNAT family N-acetyltransferase n=1 Tax=Nocardioides flavescens TaxID=2691959 RepID=UPI00301D0D88
MQESIAAWETSVVRVDGRLVGSVRGRLDPEDPRVWEVGRLMAAPDLRGRGLGRALLEHVHALAPAGVTTYRLFTGKASTRNLAIYRKAGYRPVRTLGGPSGPVVLERRRR